MAHRLMVGLAKVGKRILNDNLYQLATNYMLYSFLQRSFVYFIYSERILLASRLQARISNSFFSGNKTEFYIFKNSSILKKNKV